MTYVRPIRRDPKKGEKGKRFPAHRKWVTGHHCIVPDCNGLPIECAHVRDGLPVEDRGGMGTKPPDWWTVPLCHDHHAAQHRVGEREFEQCYGIDLREAAREFAARSPHRHKFKRGQP